MVIKWNELRDARERRGLTQEELAEHLGVSTRTITNWERTGVARKAEYKVERFFGDDLIVNGRESDVEREAAHERALNSLSLPDRADHEGWEIGPILKQVSDAELLEELLRRARTRGLVAISKRVDTPAVTRGEVSQILRGERERLTLADVKPSHVPDVPGPQDTQESYDLVANDSINEFPPGNDADFDQA